MVTSRIYSDNIMYPAIKDLKVTRISNALYSSHNLNSTYYQKKLETPAFYVFAHNRVHDHSLNIAANIIYRIEESLIIHNRSFPMLRQTNLTSYLKAHQFSLRLGPYLET